MGVVSLILGLTAVSVRALDSNDQQVEAAGLATSMAFKQPTMQDAHSVSEAYAPSLPETEEVVIIEEPDDADALAYVLGLRGGAMKAMKSPMKAMKAMKAPMKAVAMSWNSERIVG